MEKINSYKNGILHEWMSARISFALTMPLCRDNCEKRKVLADHENTLLDDIFAIYGSDACDYAKRLLNEHPLYHGWEELEKTSSDMEKETAYLSRVLYNAVRPEIIALNHAGLAEVYTSQCGEGVYLEVYACAQVMRKINRIIDNNREYVAIAHGFKEV